MRRVAEGREVMEAGQRRENHEINRKCEKRHKDDEENGRDRGISENRNKRKKILFFFTSQRTAPGHTQKGQ